MLRARSVRTFSEASAIASTSLESIRIAASPAISRNPLRSDVTMGVPHAIASVIGMSLAYLASLAGLLLAWWSWRRRNREGRDD